MDVKEVADNLASLISGTGLTDGQIAERVGRHFVPFGDRLESPSAATVRRWRIKKVMPRINEAIALARALDVSFAELVGVETKPLTEDQRIILTTFKISKLSAEDASAVILEESHERALRKQRQG